MSAPAATTALDTAPLGPGSIIAAKYELERELGRGAMGTVWQATHLSLGQRIAIKVISTERAQSPEARQRFSLEAKAAARLRSRFAVQVYDDGETSQGTPYIVFEYLDGETLEERMRREQHLPLIDAVKITTHVCRALSRAHAQGIVHRDLKPGNIFLTGDEDAAWIAKVLDFGIAKLDDQRDALTTKAGAVLGTPLFMSPEQVRRANTVDHRGDLYSLGMVFYHMVTGLYAFDRESSADVLVAICTDPLPDITMVAPHLPPGISAWFQKACARNPDERFQSAAEMLDELKACSRMPATSGAPPGTPPEGTTLKPYLPPRSSAYPRQELRAEAQALIKTQAALRTSGSGSSVQAAHALSLPAQSQDQVDGASGGIKRRTKPIFSGLLLLLGILIAALCYVTIVSLRQRGTRQAENRSAPQRLHTNEAPRAAQPLPAADPAHAQTIEVPAQPSVLATQTPPKTVTQSAAKTHKDAPKAASSASSKSVSKSSPQSSSLKAPPTVRDVGF
jgi:serine/threonine protein kinase